VNLCAVAHFGARTDWPISRRTSPLSTWQKHTLLTLTPTALCTRHSHPSDQERSTGVWCYLPYKPYRLCPTPTHPYHEKNTIKQYIVKPNANRMPRHTATHELLNITITITS